ncbi:hypothetical protein [uncultured Cohaesibacter sp.]|uniref:hypothetical protein n=1 Tax=uncultured Cohaesibacter sp. TaxID=1002546 RepID=UPI0029C8A6FA|nr:hypothetical protein [uncultured Cohaesibacter sp.]
MDEICIHRSVPNSDHTELCKEIFEAGLSLEALGLLAYLHYKAATERFDPKEARRAMGLGRDKYCRIMRELLASGWVVRQQVRNPATQAFSGTEYILRSSPGEGGAT